MRIAATLLIALLASGCTSMEWVKADAAPQQLRADLTECQDMAWREARGRILYLYPMAPAVVHDSLGRRMLIYPYGPFADPFGQQFMEEARLTDFCMHSKGWKLQEVPKPEAAKQ
jgi:hypothetical protein